MPFNRPTLTAIIDRVKTDIKGGLGVSTILRRSFLDVFSKAIAGVSHLLHGHLDFIQTNIFIDRAEVEFLDRWATIFGLTRTAATFAQLNVKFTGVATTEIPALTSVQRPDGVIYKTDALATVQTAVTGIAEETDITAVADVADSLQDTYFLYDTPLNSYYVWLNVSGGGADPLVAGRTGVPVTVATGDSADTVATAIDTALNLLTDVTSTVVTDTVSAINDAVGSVEDSVDSGGSTNTGFTFNTTTQGVTTVVGGEVVTQVTAEVAGINGNLDAGNAVTLVSPITDIDTDALVDSIATEAADEESDEALRERLLTRIQLPPVGGAANDYIVWAKETPGVDVTRAWVFPNHTGPGTVGVTFSVDNEDVIIPTAAQVALVQAYVEERAPVTANFTAFAPVGVPVDMTIALTPNTTAVRAAVAAEVRALVIREGQANGAYQDATATFSGDILRSHLGEAISLAEGEIDHEITTPPSGDFTNSATELHVPGTLTFTSL